MTTLLGIAGSTRAGSFNRSLLRAAARVAPDGVTVEEATIAGIPLYDADLETEEGLPDAVTELKERIAAADGVLLVSPEYNNSIPGTFKNAIDWLSRPPKDIGRVFGGRAFAVIGATPGRGATALAQVAWLPVLTTLGTRIFTERQLRVGGAKDVFDEDGALTDDTVRGLLEKHVAAFAAFAAAR